MKRITLIIALMLYGMLVFCQDDGGMLCGGEDEKPIWILRFKILDSETHYPIRYANIEISNDRGDAMRWVANSEGIAVLVVTTPNCLPYEGKFEITSKNYRYYQESFKKNYFSSYEDSKRIYLEGHRHNWTDMNQIPETQELINKISRKQYEVGVKKISSGHGFDWVNYAPACFEYEIELDKIRDNYYQPRRNPYQDRERDNNQNANSKIPTVSYNGERIYVFPNDLSGRTYHVEQAKNACGSLNRLGYDDWYLPSKEELKILYLNKEKIGGFSYGWYWSSTSTSDGRRYWGQSFEDGIQETENKGTTYNIHKGNIKVRCIRKD